MGVGGTLSVSTVRSTGQGDRLRARCSGCGCAPPRIGRGAGTVRRRRGKLAELGKGMVREQIVTVLPAEERDEAAQVFDSFWDDMMSGNLDQAAAEKWGEMLQQASGDGEITADEAREIIDYLRDVQGASPPVEETTSDAP